MVESISNAARSLKTAVDPKISSMVEIADHRPFISRLDYVVLKEVTQEEASNRVSKAPLRNISHSAAPSVRHTVMRCIVADPVARRTSVVRTSRVPSTARVDLHRVFNTINAAPFRSTLDHAKADAVPAARRTFIVP
jgi:hypothetical protein